MKSTKATYRQTINAKKRQIQEAKNKYQDKKNVKYLLNNSNNILG